MCVVGAVKSAADQLWHFIMATVQIVLYPMSLTIDIIIHSASIVDGVASDGFIF